MTIKNGNPPPSDLERLGEYQLVRCLARGSGSTIFEALDLRTNTLVAIKTVGQLDPEALTRFKLEFRLLAGLHHRNVVSAYELYLQAQHYFFTMELVRGVDLIEWLCGKPPVGTTMHGPCRAHGRLRDAFRQLAQGVQAVHMAGLLHRAIEPSNVLVTDEGRVVLLDFSHVHRFRHYTDPGLSHDGPIMGPPIYMSPEQVLGETVGPSSDWYAVGGLLYEALTGRTVFWDKGMLAMLEAKVEERPLAPSSLSSGIPEDLETLCMALLERDPLARPTGDQVLACLA